MSMCFLVVTLLLATLIFLILRLPVFGKLPSGERLKKIKALRNYEKGAIQNFSDTPQLAVGSSYFDLLRSFLKKRINATPAYELPHIKPDYTFIDSPVVTWFGHSSYLIQAAGKFILVDPVFSKRTSPFSFIGNLNYPGTDFVKIEDFPTLDIVLITHDHYDHLDYQTILQLKSKTKLFITSLGVGAHLEHWGIDSGKIIELSWDENYKSAEGLEFRALPARHFTGRSFKRNQTLWSSFVFKTAEHSIYLGGDSGYDKHFKEIGINYGPFDLAILECGQYNTLWPYIHMFPEETVQAAMDLKAKCLMPVHWGKFTLALHSWDEPIIRVTKHAGIAGQPITTPMLGESVVLNSYYPDKPWWLRDTNNKDS